MDADLQKFIKQLEGFTEAATKAIEATFQEIVVDIGVSLVTLSPVLTGRFKGNWQMTVGSPSNHSLNTVDEDGSATIAELKARAATLTSGEIAYIVNNLTYGYEIEVGGWPSGKPPYGVVRITAAKFDDIIKAAVAKHRVQ